VLTVSSWVSMQVGVDWTVDMGDARARLGNDVSLQGNVDPTILFADKVGSVRLVHS
jgi:uroporphyrinogen-III decarboxylase